MYLRYAHCLPHLNPVNSWGSSSTERWAVSNRYCLYMNICLYIYMYIYIYQQLYNPIGSWHLGYIDGQCYQVLPYIAYMVPMGMSTGYFFWLSLWEVRGPPSRGLLEAQIARFPHTSAPPHCEWPEILRQQDIRLSSERLSNCSSGFSQSCLQGLRKPELILVPRLEWTSVLPHLQSGKIASRKKRYPHCSCWIPPSLIVQVPSWGGTFNFCFANSNVDWL